MDFIHILPIFPIPHTLICRRAVISVPKTEESKCPDQDWKREILSNHHPLQLRKHILVSHIIKFTTNLPFTSNIALRKQKESYHVLKETDPPLTRAASCFYVPCFMSAAFDLRKFEMPPGNFDSCRICRD